MRVPAASFPACPMRLNRREALLVVPLMARPAMAQFPSPKEQIRLELAVMAEAEVNPDDKGRPAPILVRLYELKSSAAFEAADYFTLHGNDKALIGADMLVREEFILRPGETRAIRRKSHPDLGAIGVLAGYRDLGLSDWRAVQQVEAAPEIAWYRAVLPAHKLKLEVRLQARGIRLISAD